MPTKKEKIGFVLTKITTEQFAIIESSYKEDIEDLNLKIGVKFGINIKSRKLSIIFSANFSQEDSPFLIIEIACNFEINEDTWNNFLNESSTNLTIPKEFVRHLVMITVGTTRGVLHSKTENTSFNKFLLHTINVKELVKKDVTFEVGE
ncbi:hypothetical protein MHM83_04625 [Tenacibaculum sp. Mcav3-52]|uniref:hypothetical protein n=1 Tax=Tenacibaculum sp. Mcav3-52 TaxID=2917762 RepID=UPI001EF1CD74|nr:hypothetical protein [Tenacibaculum sp. Mcav3-52]MCG7501146.1 hypothetical protein [Tenacibaculum sp. Mcav3-52]